MTRQGVRREVLVAAIVFSIFWVAAQLGFVFSHHGILTPVWPPAAVAAVAAITFGPRSLWLVAGYVVFDFVGGDFTDARRVPWAWIEPLGLFASAFAVRRLAAQLAFDLRLASVRQIGILLVIAAVYSSVNGVLVTAGYCGLAHTPRCLADGAVSFWWQSFAGDFFGCLIVMPALISWARRLDPQLASRFPLGVDVASGSWRLDVKQKRFLLAGSVCIALAWLGTRQFSLPVSAIGFLVLPLLVWAALQFRPLFVHSTLLVTGLTAISLQLTSDSVSFADPRTELTSLFLFLLSLSVLTLIVNVIVQQQQTMARSLVYRAEQARIELMLQVATDAVLSFDALGRVTYLNPAADQLLQREGLQLLGSGVALVLPSPRLADLERKGIVQLMAEDRGLFSGQVFEVALTLAGHVPLTLEIGLTAYVQNGEWNATAFIRNVTSRKEQEQALRHALAHQQELNEMKSRFVSMTSHELRTPLSTILSSSELLEHYSSRLSTDEISDLYLGIRAAVKRMTVMMDDVLMIGKADAERLELKLSLIDPDQLCRDLVDEFRLSIPPGIVIEYSSSGCGAVRVDGKLLHRLLANLMSNAIKYSPQGGTVAFAVIQSPQLLRFNIGDQGIGIPADDIPRLFESFHRGKNVGSIPGTGLGMNIVKKSVERQGGQVEVDSPLGAGTTFCVNIPLPQEGFI